MKSFDWNQDKNKWLKRERGITFEEVIFHLQAGGLLDIIENPNQERYKDQRIFIVDVEGYVCMVPFVETEDGVFLKTIIPSRKMTKLYLGGEEG